MSEKLLAKFVSSKKGISIVCSKKVIFAFLQISYGLLLTRLFFVTQSMDPLNFLDRELVKLFPRKNWKSLNEFFPSKYSRIQRRCFKKCPIFCTVLETENWGYHQMRRLFFRNKETLFVDLLTFLNRELVKLLPQKNWKSLNESSPSEYSHIQRPIFAHSYKRKIKVFGICGFPQ